MITNTITNSFAPMLSNNSKVVALETTLQQSLTDFKELLIDLEQIQISLDICKAQYTELKDKCESKTCCGAEETQKVLQSIRSALTRLCETKNLEILNEILKTLFGENTTLLYPTKSKENSELLKELLTPKKELHSSNEDLSFNNESVSEIEGTPTGRHSPIIQTKKIKNSMVTSFDREKKKCPETWPTPEKKTLKLIFPTPSRSKQNSSLRQGRLNFVKTKSSNIIDITCSPEFSGGSRTTKSETDCNIQPLIKKESIENDDTILPSPTSGPNNFTLFKSPMKFKKPPLSLKTKTEKNSNVIKKVDPESENKIIKTEKKSPNSNNSRKCMENDMKQNNSATFTQEDSINILHPDRLPNNFMKNSPVEHNETTFFNTQASVSLLQHINELGDIHRENKSTSPSKRPLAENINITNIADDDELQASMSVLQRDAKISRLAMDNVKIKIAVTADGEGPAPRTRAEKRLLPGWACRECISFFSELHKDDPDMMLKKINECSHHRGITNPERPKTPPGYWNPRWNVPDDTEEFNRKNNV